MRKIIILSVLALLLMAMVLNITYLRVVNRSGYEINVKLISVDTPGQVHYLQIPFGDRGVDNEAEVFYAIVSGKYSVTANGRTVKIDSANNRFVYGDWVNCYGYADGLLWDDYRAARVIEFLKGQRTLKFTPDSCQQLPTLVRSYWLNLALDSFEYQISKGIGYFEY